MIRIGVFNYFGTLNELLTIHRPTDDEEENDASF